MVLTPVPMAVQLVEPSAEYSQVPWAAVEALPTTTMPAIACAELPPATVSVASL